MQRPNKSVFALIVVVAVLVAGAFAGGMAFERHSPPSHEMFLGQTAFFKQEMVYGWHYLFAMDRMTDGQLEVHRDITRGRLRNYVIIAGSYLSNFPVQDDERRVLEQFLFNARRHIPANSGAAAELVSNALAMGKNHHADGAK
ncbi:MAG: hypothetical protein HN366_22220 [Deltaproteobacteria bacterium]|nr:hypothetical protein [Deltaproteobacteria bacterium]